VLLKWFALFWSRAVSLIFVFWSLAGRGLTQLQLFEPCRQVVLTSPELPADSLESWEKWEQFGVEIPINLSTKLAAGECVLFTAPGAISLSLNMDEGYLPQNGRVLVKNEKGDLWQELSAALWQRGTIWPSTLPCYGDSLLLVYVGPDSARISVASVVYGYRDWRARGRGFGDSGPCNNNVNCGFEEWNNEKRSVVMMLTAGNTRKCSGALINNTAQDGRPLVLTARHCNVVTNNIFLFNYESPGCHAVDGPVDQWIQGCTILASWAPSDFTLVELSTPPPQDFFPFYAGWNRTLILPSSGVTSIHHPRGDVKKITFAHLNPQPAPYITASDTTRDHWHIAAWDSGTTEPVSSGSPLFDAQHRMIGQLHGGQASCNFNFNDYYGMLYYSWNGGGTPATALQPWLDPLGLNSSGLSGLDPYQPLWNIDAGFTENQLEFNICEDTISVLLKIRNYGLDTITGIRIKRITSHSIQPVLDSTIHLPYSALRSFTVVFDSPLPGTMRQEILVLEAYPETDENPLNDTLRIFMQREKGENIFIRIFTDTYGGEVNAFLLNDNLDTVWQASNLSANTLNTWTLCSSYGCYVFRLTDSGGDGLCCNHGYGFAELESALGRIMGRVEQFGSQAELKFCIPFADPSLRPLIIYPVPVRDVLNVLYEIEDSQAGVARWYICTPEGRSVKEGFWHNYLNTFDVSALAAGVYLFTIREKDKFATRKFIKI
jgi:hypothetical protein